MDPSVQGHDHSDWTQGGALADPQLGALGQRISEAEQDAEAVVVRVEALEVAPPTHVHAAGDITSGTVATARLGSGTANSGTFLRGDQSWQAAGGGSTPTGTGFRHVTAGVEDAASVTLAESDVTNLVSDLSGKAASSHAHAQGDLTGLTTASSPQFAGVNVGDSADTTITRTGAGAIAVEGVQVLLSGAALGTPASGTLSGCTALPVAGITASTTQALGVGSLEVGHASDSTVSRNAAGIIQVESLPLLMRGAAYPCDYYKVLKSSDQTELGTAFADITNLVLGVFANGVYMKFLYLLIMDSDATTTGIDVSVYSATAANVLEYTVQSWTTAGAITTKGFNAYDGDTANTASCGATRRIFRIEGIVALNGAGSINPRGKREAVGTGSNCRAGSCGFAWMLG